MAPPVAPPPQGAALDDAARVGVDYDDDEEEEDPEELWSWVPSSDSEPEPDGPDHPALVPSTPPHASAETEHKAAVEAPVGAEKKVEGEEARPRWPGWPGVSVFRLVVPAHMVGGIIGRRGETIKRLCEDTRARVRVLDAAHGAANRIVLISATEEVDAELSPAMNAAIKIFKHINEIEEINSDGTLSASAPDICSVRLLVSSAHAVHLIGKQGITIKSIQESTGATIRIIDEDELLSCEAVNERIVEVHGASLMVHSALKSVLGLLRKFLVDHGVLHLFERKKQSVAQAQDTSKENQVIDDYPLAVNQDFFISVQRSHGNPEGSILFNGRDQSFCDPYSSDISHGTGSLITQRSHVNPKGSRVLYGRDPSFRDPYSPDLSQPTDSLIKQITQTMQIPLPYAEEIIGVRGENIEFIRSASGAVVVLEEIGYYPNEVLVMIKGSPSQVQAAHQLVQEILSGNREPLPSRSSHRSVDAGPWLLNSPHAGSSLAHSPHAIAASRDYQPSNYDQPSSNDRRYSTHRGYRG